MMSVCLAFTLQRQRLTLPPDRRLETGTGVSLRADANADGDRPPNR
jgi:hypothetical protein